MSLTFLITALVIVAIPGTGAIYSMSAGLTRGTRSGVLAAFACTLGIVPHLVAAVTGLAALLHASGVAFQVVRYAGVAYLLYLAWSTWRDQGALSLGDDTVQQSAWRVIGTGITLNLLNPKLTVFFFAFLPQFVPAGTPNATMRMLALSGVFMLLTFVVFSGYAAAAAALRTQVIERPHVVRRIRRTFAASFALLAGRLALADR